MNQNPEEKAKELYCKYRDALIYLHLIKMNMTPEEKAKELYCKYRDALNIRDLQTKTNLFAKQFALIAVDEILNINSVDKDFSLSHYWLDVKDEIENL